MNEETIFLTKASLASYEEYIKEIKSIWENNWITTFGPKHNQLEQCLQEYLGVNSVALFSNGHSALETALKAIGKEGGEIITSPYTFASTTSAIVNSGYVPVFCDINPETYNIDSKRIEELISEKTVAILPIHVYGNVCDVEKIEEIAYRHKLKVIYDAAHAFGVKYKGQSVATFGDAVVFSFHASKVFNTAEGGAICYKDACYGEQLKCIRNFGLDNGDGVYVAGNGKMSELSASLGLCNLKHIDEFIEKRRELTWIYMEQLADLKELSFRILQEDVISNYSYFPVKIIDENTRDLIFDKLHLHNILCQKQFGKPTNEFVCYKGKYRGSTPNADAVSKRVLLLPLFSDLKEHQVIYICSLIHKILRER